MKWWGNTKRRDRLARFGTLEDGNIEQPFKPIKSVGKGDNTRPLWQNGSPNRDWYRAALGTILIPSLMSNLALCTSSGESAMYSMKAFTTSAIPLNCESGRDLPKRGTLGGENFPMLKAIHLYRSYLSSGLQARWEMELVCSNRYPFGDFLSIV